MIRRGLAWLPPLAWAGVIYFVSAQPKEAFVRFGLSGALLPIAGHLITYAVLMVLLVIALRVGGRLPVEQSCVVAFLLVALFGLSDEYHQSRPYGDDVGLACRSIGGWAGLASYQPLEWSGTSETARLGSQGTTR